MSEGSRKDGFAPPELQNEGALVDLAVVEVLAGGRPFPWVQNIDAYAAHVDRRRFRVEVPRRDALLLHLLHQGAAPIDERLVAVCPYFRHVEIIQYIRKAVHMVGVGVGQDDRVDRSRSARARGRGRRRSGPHRSDRRGNRPRQQASVSRREIRRGSNYQEAMIIPVKIRAVM